MFSQALEAKHCRRLGQGTSPLEQQQKSVLHLISNLVSSGNPGSVARHLSFHGRTTYLQTQIEFKAYGPFLIALALSRINLADLA